MKLKILQIVAIGVLFSLFVTPAKAVTAVFEDDFEDDTAVLWPDAGNDADPVTALGSWLTLIEQSGGSSDTLVDVQVLNNPSPGAAGGSNYLVVNRVGAAQAWANLSRTVSNANLTIEFDLYVEGSADYNDGLLFAVRSEDDFNGSFSSGVVLQDIYHPSNGWIVCYPEGAGNAYGTFSADSWVHVRYDIDTVANTYTLTVDSTVIAGDIAFYSPQTEIKQIVFYAADPGTTFYIDNIYVETDMDIVLPPELIADLLADDFENVEPAAWPDPSVDADPVAQRGAWITVFEQSGGMADVNQDVQVTDNADPGPATLDSSQYLVINRVQNGYAWVTGNFLVPGGPEVIGLEFDMYVAGGDDYNAGLSLILRDIISDDVNAGRYIIYDLFRQTGNLAYWQSTGSQSIGSFATDTWLHVQLILDFVTHTYDLSVGGNLYEDLPFQETVNEIKQVILLGSYYDSLIYIDNFKVKTSEPLCLQQPRGDLDGNCRVDFMDFVQIGTAWLDCNLDPITLCD